MELRNEKIFKNNKIVNQNRFEKKGKENVLLKIIDLMKE